MRSLRICALALATAGCSNESGEPVVRNSEAETAAVPPTPASNMGAPTPAVGPRALQSAGEPLTGSVSGLSGEITGFEVRKTATQTIVEIAADVLFDFDKSTLSADAPPRLARAAALIQQGGAGTVIVAGHTDAKGDDAYNQKLSLARARAVTTWLVNSGGVPADRLEAQGRGEAEPIAPNTDAAGADDPAGRAKNRRVSLAIPR